MPITALHTTGTQNTAPGQPGDASVTAQTHTDDAFEEMKAAVNLSLTGTPEMWRLYRTSGATAAMVKDLFPYKKDRDYRGRYIIRDAMRMLGDACATNRWDLDTLNEYIISAIASQTATNQKLFYDWQPLRMEAMAAMFDTDVNDPRLRSVNSLFRTVNAYAAFWTNPTRGMLVAVTPIWFDLCDAALEVSL